MKKAERGALSAVLVCLLSLPLIGCSSLRRARECQRMVDTVNGSLSQLPNDADAGASPATYLRLADAYDALAKQLEGARSEDPALSKAFDSYRELIQRAARQSRLFAEELDKPVSTPEEQAEKETRLARIRTQSKGEVSREASLVRKLNGLCHP
ncbi:MAG TPA: hypothetical protein VFS67_13865 [Polyangiaceae bacterium]|nr:hypothetical protein [Polyangiaceae bacterium]